MYYDWKKHLKNKKQKQKYEILSVIEIVINHNVGIITL